MTLLLDTAVYCTKSPCDDHPIANATVWDIALVFLALVGITIVFTLVVLYLLRRLERFLMPFLLRLLKIS
jgi:hypothetical protein